MKITAPTIHNVIIIQKEVKRLKMPKLRLFAVHGLILIAHVCICFT